LGAFGVKSQTVRQLLEEIANHDRAGRYENAFIVAKYLAYQLKKKSKKEEEQK
jgi:hypothetical protein